MDGQTRSFSPDAMAQHFGGVLDSETAAMIGEVLMHLSVAANSCELAVSYPDTARGMLRVAQAQGEAATSALREWRDGGLQSAGPTMGSE